MVRKVALYEIPETLETARVLDDSILNSYNESVKSFYNSDRARNILSQFSRIDGELAGSNPFMLVQLQNSGLIDGRIATRNDLEKASKKGLYLLGNYTDFGLALKTAGDSRKSNDLLARNLAEQLKKRGISLKKGRLISISALKLREDANSEYGLVFDLNENIKDIEDLSEYRWNHTKEQGIARACLNWGSSWGFSSGSLGDSFSDGRVVVISDEAIAKNFLDVKLAELQKQRDKEINKVNEKYAQAERILLSK